MNLNTRHKNWLPSLIFSPLRRALQNPSPGQGEDQGEGPCKPRAMGARCVRNSARGVKVLAGELDPAIFCRTLTASRCALGRLSQSGRGLGRAASLVLQSSPEGEN